MLKSIFRFLLVLTIAITIGIGVYYAEQGVIHLLGSSGLISNDSEEIQSVDLESKQPQGVPDRQTLSIFRPLLGGLFGMGVHFVFFAITVVAVILIRKPISKLPLPKLKQAPPPK
jgi:hypothetical protein